MASPHKTKSRTPVKARAKARAKGKSPATAGKARADSPAAALPARLKVPARLVKAIQRVEKTGARMSRSEEKLAEEFVTETFGPEAWSVRQDLRRSELEADRRELLSFHERGKLLADLKKIRKECALIVAASLGCSRTRCYDMIAFATRTTKTALNQLIAAINDGKLPRITFKEITSLMRLTSDKYEQALANLAAGTTDVNKLMLELQGKEKTRPGRLPEFPVDLDRQLLSLREAETRHTRLLTVARDKVGNLTERLATIRDEEQAAKLAKVLEANLHLLDEDAELISYLMEVQQQGLEELARTFNISVTSLSQAGANGQLALPAPEAGIHDDTDDEDEDDETEDEAVEDDEDEEEEEEEEDEESDEDEDDEDEDEDEDEEQELELKQPAAPPRVRRR